MRKKEDEITLYTLFNHSLNDDEKERREKS